MVIQTKRLPGGMALPRHPGKGCPQDFGEINVDGERQSGKTASFIPGHAIHIDDVEWAAGIMGLQDPCTDSERTMSARN